MISFDLYLRQYWSDPRLAFGEKGDDEKLVFGAEMAEKIWVPDTVVLNERETSFHETPSKSQA